MDAAMHRLPERMHRAALDAIIDEGEHLREEVVVGLLSGSPGGHPFAPHSTLTELLGQGAGGQVMFRSGGVAAAVAVVVTDTGVFIGVTGDKEPLARLLSEGGTFPHPISPRARRFLFGAMRRAGVVPSEGGTGTIRIPGRPFVEPVVEQELPGSEARIGKRFAQNMGGLFGSP